MPIKETVLEISIKNLKENFKFLKSKINPTTKFMAVVKAFSYGSDSKIISDELKKRNIDFIIDDTDESFSAKIKKFNLIGIPFQIMIGNKNEGDKFEFSKVGEEASILSIDEIIEYINKSKK